MSSRGSELTLNTKRMMGHKDERKPEKRRLVIRPIKVQPRLGEDLAEETMKRLEEAFMCIQEGKPLEKSMEELYRSVEDLCIHKKAEVLFGRLKRLMEVEAQRNVDTLSKLNGEKGELLESVAFIWNEHCRQMKIIRSIFLYLDRSYVHLLKDAKSLWELSLQLYKNKFEFQQNKNLDDAIIKEALHVIQKERDGELISHGLLNTVVRMLTALKFYSKLESRFLSDSKKYYLNESEHVFVSASIPEYLVYTLKRIREEEERIQNYLNPSTLEPLVHVVRDEFIRNRASDILKKGFTKLLDSESIDNLKKMYSLFSSVSQLPKLNLAFGEYIINTGSVIVKDPSKDQDMVQDLLKLKVKLDIALKSAFDDDADFSQTIKVSFENFINLRKNKPAELVAKYLDGILRSGNRTASEKEAEDILNSVMVIFRYIDGKDVFEAFYKKDLAKRLILGKCASVEAERSMISKLRLECGHSFTNKLEGMFSDIEVSNKLLSEFKQVNHASFVFFRSFELLIFWISFSFVFKIRKSLNSILMSMFSPWDIGQRIPRLCCVSLHRL